jgi:hypothetical protein
MPVLVVRSAISVEDVPLSKREVAFVVNNLDRGQVLRQSVVQGQIITATEEVDFLVRCNGGIL